MLCAAMGREERLRAFRLHEDRSIGSEGLKGTACKIRISPHRCRSQFAEGQVGWCVPTLDCMNLEAAGTRQRQTA